ncbi:MAG: polysaccharide deacetylase family protein [Deltaproteobacteria bacterium]|nr:polysaccharide deacetylase family protein [Deltaproteobacteria bacterium]
MKTCAVSIDLDPIRHYYGIHGIAVAPEDRACTAGLERFLAFADERRFKATLFVVAAELSRPAFVSIIKDAARAGHEIANHTLSHRYDLSRLPAEEIKKEILDAHVKIAAAAGRGPAGFRAPGYTLCGTMIEVLETAGYAYDSSAFSSAPYYAVKAAVMGASHIAGRKSAAILAPASSLSAPSKPYHPSPDDPYAEGGAKLLEFPIPLTPVLGVPLIGTTFVLAGKAWGRVLLRGIDSHAMFNLEFHGIDFLDRAEVGEGLLKARQPDARLGLETKMERFGRLFDYLKDRRFETLSQAASRMGENAK